MEQFLGCMCVIDSVWALVQSNKDDSDGQKAIVDDNKGSLAAASIIFLLVSVLSVNVFSILFCGWVTMVTWPRRLPRKENDLCWQTKMLMFIYVNVCRGAGQILNIWSLLLFYFAQIIYLHITLIMRLQGKIKFRGFLSSENDTFNKQDNSILISLIFTKKVINHLLTISFGQNRNNLVSKNWTCHFGTKAPSFTNR